MSIYTLFFYIMDIYIITKNAINRVIDYAYTVPIVAFVLHKCKSTVKMVHDAIFMTHVEPTEVPWLSITYVKRELLGEPVKIKEQDTEYEFDYVECKEDAEKKYEYKMIENFVEKPVHIYGKNVAICSTDSTSKPLFLFPEDNVSASTPTIRTKSRNDPVENPWEDQYDNSVLKNFIKNSLPYVKYNLPLLYVLKAGDEGIADYTKNNNNALEFFSYMIVQLNVKMDEFENKPASVKHDYVMNKIFKTLHIRRPSKLRFLSMEYVHPDMDHYIPIEIPENMLYVGNEILSSTFILRYLEYSGYQFAFDDKYRVVIMTKDIQYIELNVNKYLYLNENDGYTIEELL